MPPEDARPPAPVQEEPASENRDFGRIIALSDGVFAFAMTLLVVLLVLPTLSAGRSQDLPGYLRDFLPTLGGYALSFFVVASWWMQHYRLFGAIRRYDDRLVRLNLVFLFLVSITPFLLAIVLAFGPDSFLGGDLSSKLAIAIYGGFQVLAGLVFYGMIRWATDGRRLVDPRLAEEQVHLAKRTVEGRIAVMLISMAVAVVSPAFAEIAWSGILLDQRLLRGRASRLPPATAPPPTR